jgi:excisionase family DNA binding protein
VPHCSSSAPPGASTSPKPRRDQPRPTARPARRRARAIYGHPGRRRLGPPERFIRRLIAQRRIRFYKVGRHIRFDVTDLDNSIDTGRRVEPRL